MPRPEVLRRVNSTRRVKAGRSRTKVPLPRKCARLFAGAGWSAFPALSQSASSRRRLELLYRRVLAITGIAWLPLLLLSTIGLVPGHAGRMSFFTDVEVHA